MAERVKCKVCKRSLRGQVGLQMHQKVKGCFFSCHECDVHFYTAAELGQHREEQIESGSITHYFECKHCEAKCRSQKALDEHILNLHEFKCNTCGRSFRTYVALRQHQEVKRHKLSELDQDQHEQTYMLHKIILQAASSVKPKNRCDFCLKILKSAAGLREHQNQKRCYNTCKHCNVKFYSIRETLEHLKDEDLKGVDIVVSCCKCPDKFLTLESLDEHVKDSHTFECIACPKIFSAYF